MFLVCHNSFTVSEEVYDIKLDDGSIVQYKEWSDGNGKILDAAIKDKKGREIEDANLLQKIWKLVESK